MKKDEIISVKSYTDTDLTAMEKYGILKGGGGTPINERIKEGESMDIGTVYHIVKVHRVNDEAAKPENKDFESYAIIAENGVYTTRSDYVAGSIDEAIEFFENEGITSGKIAFNITAQKGTNHDVFFTAVPYELF